MRNEVYFGVGTKAITSIPKLSCRTPMDAAIASDIILPYSQNTVCMDELCVMKVFCYQFPPPKKGMYTTTNYNIPMLPLVPSTGTNRECGHVKDKSTLFVVGVSTG